MALASGVLIASFLGGSESPSANYSYWYKWLCPCTHQEAAGLVGFTTTTTPHLIYLTNRQHSRGSIWTAMTDNRHAYFIRCISAISGIGPNPVFDSLDPLAAFLDDPSCTVLRAWVRENGTVLLSKLLTTEEAVASTTAYLQNVLYCSVNF